MKKDHSDLIDEENLKIRHNSSKQTYPYLNLSENEYVISVVERHPVGLVIPFTVALILIISSFFALSFILSNDLNFYAINRIGASFLISMFILLIIIILYLYNYVYTNNRFYVTNECVIQHIQLSPFSRKEQSINLSNIEDVSYHQLGIIQHILNYGTIKLSTIGDEHTYIFNYVYNPLQKKNSLHNTIESFKNGRPIDSI